MGDQHGQGLSKGGIFRTHAWSGTCHGAHGTSRKRRWEAQHCMSALTAAYLKWNLNPILQGYVDEISQGPKARTNIFKVLGPTTKNHDLAH